MLIESSLGPRMGRVVDGAEALTADVSVPLGGGQIGVTQQLLHRAEVGAPVEQVCGEGVPEGVRVGGRRRPAVEDAPDVTATTSISQYLFTGSLVYHFGGAGARTTPFIAGGAGHVRDVHSGNGLVETGVEYHGKAGVKLWFGRGQNNGLRIEGGVSIRDGGFTLDDDRRVVPNASASFAYRF